MIPSTRDLVELIDMIWSTTLGFEIHSVDAAHHDGWSLPAVEAQVHIVGTWQGVVALHTSQTLAARIAQHMFNLGAEPPTLEDMQDAFGEIANIASGNIKGLISEGNAHLSLPAVVQGHDYSVSVPGSEQIAQVAFLSDGEPLVVTILRAQKVRSADDAPPRSTDRRRTPRLPSV